MTSLAKGLLSAVIVVLMGGQSMAATIEVPLDQPTIQAGIDAASDGDTVLVADGTYTGPGNRDIVWDGKQLTLRSVSGAASTIIDIDGEVLSKHRGLTILNVDSTSSVAGFTIRNAYIDAGGAGGAVRLIGNAAIRDCVFEDNLCSEGGGGVLVSGTNVIIEDCVFLRNSATSVIGIIGNSGGGLVVSQQSSVYLDRCLFVDNLAKNAAALFVPGGNPFSATGEVHAYQCTFVGNESWQDTTAGATANIFIADGSSTIENCIIAFNPLAPAFHSYTAMAISCTDIYGNADGNWTGLIAPLLGTDGNFSEDPAFCDTASNDFSIESFSMCASANSPCGQLVGALDVGCAGCADVDGDGFCFDVDNCPTTANPGQEDVDGDGIGDVCDNCPSNFNPNQFDYDGDGIGDSCDNCYYVANNDQANQDGDEYGDVCDMCPTTMNPCPTSCNVPGNAQGGDLLDYAESLFYMRDWLFNGGPPPPNPIDADFDYYTGIRVRDFAWISVLFVDGSYACPSLTPYDYTVDSSVWFEYVDTAPPHDGQLEIPITLFTLQELVGLNLPMRITIGGNPVAVDSFVAVLPLQYQTRNVLSWGADTGIVNLFGYQYTQTPVAPGQYVLGSLYVSLPPSAVSQSVVLEFVELQPVQPLQSTGIDVAIKAETYSYGTPTPPTDLLPLHVPYLQGVDCCIGIRGNVNGDALQNIDISDLTLLTAYMFKGTGELPCFDEANVNGIGDLDVSDLTYFVSFMFKGGPDPAACP